MTHRTSKYKITRVESEILKILDEAGEEPVAQLAHIDQLNDLHELAESIRRLIRLGLVSLACEEGPSGGSIQFHVLDDDEIESYLRQMSTCQALAHDNRIWIIATQNK